MSDQPTTFERDLTALINRYSMEGYAGDVPDFIIARYLVAQLATLGATRRDLAEHEGFRERHGFESSPRVDLEHTPDPAPTRPVDPPEPSPLALLLRKVADLVEHDPEIKSIKLSAYEHRGPVVEIGGDVGLEFVQRMDGAHVEREWYGHEHHHDGGAQREWTATADGVKWEAIEVGVPRRSSRSAPRAGSSYEDDISRAELSAAGMPTGDPSPCATSGSPVDTAADLLGLEPERKVSDGVIVYDETLSALHVLPAGVVLPDRPAGWNLSVSSDEYHPDEVLVELVATNEECRDDDARAWFPAATDAFNRRSWSAKNVARRTPGGRGWFVVYYDDMPF